MKDLNHTGGLRNLFNNPPNRCEHRVSLSGFASTDFFLLAVSNNSLESYVVTYAFDARMW